jgi:hypothetical protein
VDRDGREPLAPAIGGRVRAGVGPRDGEHHAKRAAPDRPIEDMPGVGRARIEHGERARRDVELQRQHADVDRVRPQVLAVVQKSADVADREHLFARAVARGCRDDWPHRAAGRERDRCRCRFCGRGVFGRRFCARRRLRALCPRALARLR